MSRTILLADDSVTIQKVIELTFMDEDYEVVAVGNGDDALEQLDEITPDFVIADVHMPGADGYDVAKHSKSLRPEVPVLLLVGTFEPFDEEQAERSGCDAFLKKPFDSQELQRLVEQLSAEARGETGPGEGPLEATGWNADAGAAQDAGEPDSGGSQTPGATQAAPGADEVAAEPLVGASGGEAASGFGMEREESKAEPFSIGLDDDDEEPPSTRVEPPEPPEEAPTPGDVGSTAEMGAAATAEDTEPELPADSEAVDTEPPAAESAPPDAGWEQQAPDAGAEPPSPDEPAPAASGTEEIPPAAAGALSDDDVDRIARRVVELLGDGPIRDVAWEVVPDLAEVVIRGRLRELEAGVEVGETGEPEEADEADGPSGPDV